MTGSEIEVSLEAAIVAVTDGAPRLLTVDGPRGVPALPAGLLAPEDRTLELGLRRWVEEQTGLQVGYVEQLYTFGDQDRSGAEAGGARQLSIAYLALVQEVAPSAEASWEDVYSFLPWEDHRDGPPAMIADRIRPELERYVADGGLDAPARAERVAMVFGQASSFDGQRVLERYELMYEVGLLAGSPAERRTGVGPGVVASREMHLDHRRIAATALGRLRSKLTYRPVVFELLPPQFTLLQLQQLVEALSGVGLHKQNFRRLVEGAGLVEGTGELARTGGRPAELFRFRREVLGERPAPGVGSPWVRA